MDLAANPKNRSPNDFEVMDYRMIMVCDKEVSCSTEKENTVIGRSGFGLQLLLSNNIFQFKYFRPKN